jgi:hypothetical protein
MSRNEKFYLFVFEEVFRKYFGAEMSNQFHYMNNRTPFLDTVFLKGLLGTGLAGVYSDFLEKNPISRFKGQVLYAHLIRSTYPHYNKILTDKGYRPQDLLTLTGKLRITRSYLSKKLGISKSGGDPNSVGGAFTYNKAFFQRQPIDPGIFNIKKFESFFESNQATHDFLISLSQSWFLNRLSETSAVKMGIGVH